VEKMTVYADDYEEKGNNNSRQYEENGLVHEAYIPILLCGLTEEDIEYWRKRMIESYDKIVEGFNRTFLNGIDRESGEYIGSCTCFRKYLIEKSVDNYYVFVDEDCDRDFIKIKMLHGLIESCNEYLTKISKVRDNKEWYLERIEIGYSKILFNRSRVGGLMGSRRGYLDAGFITTGLITGQRYVLKYLRPFDVLIPDRWVKNLFREKWLIARHRLYRIFNKLSTLLHFMIEGKLGLNKVNQVLINHIENEVKPLVWIEKYELNELKIIEDDLFPAGIIYIKVTQKI